MRIKPKFSILIRIALLVVIIASYNRLFQNTYMRKEQMKRQLLTKEKELISTFTQYSKLKERRDNLKQIQAIDVALPNRATFKKTLKNHITMISAIDRRQFQLNLSDPMQNSDVTIVPFNLEMKEPFSLAAEYLERLEKQNPPVVFKNIKFLPSADDFEEVYVSISGFIYIPR